MTTIRIPVTHERLPCSNPAMNSVPVPAITITHEIQSQLLAPVMERLEACEQRGNLFVERVAYMEKRMAELEGIVNLQLASERGTVLCRTVTTGGPWPPKDQPAGDDAAVRVIATILSDTSVKRASYAEDAKTIIAAIRRGEVPGVYTDSPPLVCGYDDAMRERDGQIATLRANLAQAEHQRDAWKAEKEKAEEKLETERANGNWQGQHELEMTRVRENNLRAELANERAFRQEDRQTLEVVKADLAAMTERAERAEESQRLTQKAREDDRGRLQQKCSDWGTYWRASDSHGVKLNIAQATELLADALGVEVEIDAARAEADALRAAIQHVATFGKPREGSDAYHNAFSAMLRAAGVEVES